MDQGKRSRRRWRAPGALICVLALAGGCQFGAKKQPPLEAPRAELASGHFAGSALSGPQARTLDDAAVQKSWLVEAHVFATDAALPDGFHRLGADARLIVATRGGAPVAPSSRMTADLLVHWGAPQTEPIVAPDRAAKLGDPVLAIVPGTTVELQVSNAADLPVIQTMALGEDVEPTLFPATVVVRLSRGAEPGKYELSVVVRQTVPIEPTEPAPPVDQDLIVAPPPPPLRTEQREEMLLVDRDIAASDRLVLAAPMRFAGSRASHVLIDLSIATDPSTDPRLAQATQALREDALKASDAVAKRVALSSASAADLAIGSALGALSQAGDEPRGALAYLADQCEAGLTRDVVLVADKPLLQLIAKSVAERAPGLAKRDKPNIGWLLERTTVAAIAASAGDDKHPLTPAVEGALITYAGEVGRQLDALQSVVGRANGLEDLRNRLITEHLLYLEDISPAARVRAYDWLVAWHAAPEGFDPLDTARNRRAALEKAQQPKPANAPVQSPLRPTTQPTTSPTTQPDNAS